MKVNEHIARSERTLDKGFSMNNNFKGIRELTAFGSPSTILSVLFREATSQYEKNQSFKML